jgi:hypothetical protein
VRVHPGARRTDGDTRGHEIGASLADGNWWPRAGTRYHRPVDVDTAGWSGDGDFTQRLIEVIGRFPAVKLLKVEDAPASRADAGFSFISNELFVVFESVARTIRGRWFGILPVSTTIQAKGMTLAGLEVALSGIEDIGESDYQDDGMLQYLRTQRIIPPYQTRGYKLVELVRIYEGSTRPTERGPVGRSTSG